MDERSVNSCPSRRLGGFPPGLLTLTDASFLVEVVACWTFALETAEGVDADSALAEAGQLLALVYV